MTVGLIATPWAAAASGLVLAAVVVRVLAMCVRPRTVAVAVSIAGMGGLVATSMVPVQQAVSRADGASGARNVLVIGVDSLSYGLMRESAREMPNLAALLEAGISFERAYTPLGRTFPSWVSLLSGRSPAEHGALFNLRRTDRVERGDLVTRTLREAGYRTVFAMDERRFSNIDESFGFDRVVGPKAGILDFVLQRLNDTPLTNLLLQTPLSDRLLPYSRYNVASHVNYDAGGFVDAVADSLNGAGKVFLALHLESAHYPFHTRHAQRSVDDENEFRRKHREALSVVDAQVGRLLSTLRRGGYLDDALVVLVSDHGEGLGETEASTTRGGEHFEVAGYGHGADVVSEAQNRIVLGLVPHRNGAPVQIGERRQDIVSTMDLRAAIERFAVGGEVALLPRAECFFVETGLRLWAAADYRTLDQASVAKEGAGYYEVSPAGRMQLREERLPDLVESKDVGWRCKDRITYYSSHHDRFFAYSIGELGDSLVETAPRQDDIERIHGYRKMLAIAAVGGPADGARPVVGAQR